VNTATQHDQDTGQMRAVVHERYGPPDVLHVEQVARPSPGSDELLVKVHACTVNRTDCGFRAAKPFIVRFFAGLVRPKQRILGTEFAGIIAAVGDAVTDFAVGDRVFGVNADVFGAQAEYVSVKQDAPVALMPAGVSFAEAAALCDGAILALAYLRQAAVGTGTRIVVYGASGSIGSAAVQLAKHLDADVTAVCGAGSAELVGALGADTVLDYRHEDFTETVDPYDVVFDAVGKLSFARCRKAVKDGGMYLSTDLGPWQQNPALALWTARFGRKRVAFPLPRYTRADVELVKLLVESGEYRAVVDRHYALEDVVAATRYVETETKTGSVVLCITEGADRTSDPGTRA
jgi:NADPH:quinone reductase-like Zn-dependent oxidoreductase